MLRYAQRKWPDKGYLRWGAVWGKRIFFSCPYEDVTTRHRTHEVVHALQCIRSKGMFRFLWSYLVIQRKVPYHDKWQEVEARKYALKPLNEYMSDFNLDIEDILWDEVR